MKKTKEKEILCFYICEIVSETAYLQVLFDSFVGKLSKMDKLWNLSSNFNCHIQVSYLF